MSVKEVQAALTRSGDDDALVRHFLSIWPLVVGILEAFSKATGLPIFGFLGEANVFQSSVETMPPFCRAMLGSPATAERCVADGRRRAISAEDVRTKANVQYCHAGMLNGRCEIDLGALGTLTILFGSKKGVDDTAVARRRAVIAAVAVSDSTLARKLEAANLTDDNVGDIASSDVALMDAIASVIGRLVGATVGVRSLTINMAHELSLMMLNAGLLAREMAKPIASLGPHNIDEARAELERQRRHIHAECQLGLHIVRNFLSYTSETRYAEVVKPRFAEVDLTELIVESVDLHAYFATTKNINFHVADLALPKIVGSAMELRRLFNNVFNNAIKYSYHSTTESRRTIRVRSKVPYDPGFARPRFAVVVENYGLGIRDDEKPNVFKAGFRGHQARTEVSIGAGIGLSEALKIMRLHNGDIKIRSRAVHETATGEHTYLTSVELIFPYREALR